MPAFGAHVDYGRRTIEDMVRPLLGDKADYWFSKRVVLMNFWRPITTVYRTPLRCAMHRRCQPMTCIPAKCVVAWTTPIARRCMAST